MHCTSKNKTLLKIIKNLKHQIKQIMHANALPFKLLQSSVVKLFKDQPSVIHIKL